MNENLPPKMPTYSSWLFEATDLLKKANIASARLDAELILAHTIRKPRPYLHAHGDELLSERHENIASARLELRLDYTPIAYIIGHKEFYGRQFKTTPAALIPRPETETMIEMINGIIPKNLSLLSDKLHVVDVGTGTGCIGITTKLEWPECDVTLTDISTHALNLAKENAVRLGADVQFVKANLLHGYALPIDILLANLPYVDRQWEVSVETNAEPQEALYADSSGFALIKRLAHQASGLVRSGGHMLLESDPRQHAYVIKLAHEYGFSHEQTEGFITSFIKI
jgi:release factor glutamine methyltransferase